VEVGQTLRNVFRSHENLQFRSEELDALTGRVLRQYGSRLL